MAQPITWQTVRAGSDAAEAARPLEQSRQTFGDAFGAFQNIIAQREAVDRANVAATQEIGKQAFLDKLASAKTPEELAALQRSGELDTSALGVQARQALRGSEEARLTGLRQGAVATNTFDDMLRARAEQPVVDAVKAKILAGDIAGAQVDLNGSSLKDKAPLQQLIHDTGRQRLGEQRADALAPFTYNTAVRADETGKLTLAETQRTTEEAAAQRAIEARLTAEVAKRQTESAPARAVLENVAKSFPEIPRNTDGSIAFDRLSTAQKEFLDGHLKLAKTETTVDKLIGGDTRAAAAFKDSLRKSGATPTQIAKIDPIIGSAFNTGATPVTGADADSQQRTLRAFQADEAKVTDQFGQVTNNGAKAELLKQGTEILNGITTGMTGGRERYTRALAGWLDKGGIDVGGGERVLPSPAQLQLLLSKVRTGLVFNAQSDVTSILDDWANSSEAKQGAKEVIRVRDRNRLLGIDPLGKK